MSFNSLGLSWRSLEGARQAGYTQPTPIQSAAIPVVLSGQDLIACAQTGTGKTAAFVLPALDLLARTPGALVLVLVPTRELARQVADHVHTLSAPHHAHVAQVLGGTPMGPQVRALARPLDFIVATPGRLIDHLERGSAHLDAVRLLVLDEADRMLDMGFAPQVQRILRRLHSAHQTLLFSATMPSPQDPQWREVLTVGLRSPERITVGPTRPPARAEQALWLVDEQAAKTPALLGLLGEEPGNVLVFTRTRHRADRVARQLSLAGHRTERIHGDRSQVQRDRALEDFRAARVRILVATDLAARGLDVEGVAHVVNYDLPATPEDYVHRVGRTARAERRGRATSFVLSEERPALKQIERLIGQGLPALEDHRGARGAPVTTPPPRPAPLHSDVAPAPQARGHFRATVATARPRHSFK